MTTTVMKIDVSKQYGSGPDFQLQQIAEAVNLLQGVTDQDQRAVRQFEFQQQINALSARLAKAGF